MNNSFLKRFTFAALLIGCVMLQSVVCQAASLTGPNWSFEFQNVTPPFPVDTRVDSWQKAPKPAYFDEAAFGFLWDQTVGVFPNPAFGQPGYIDNMHGNQGAYFLAFPGASLFQHYTTTDWRGTTGEFDARYQVGQSYQLTVGLFGKGGMTTNSSFLLSLYYLDPANNPITIAATAINYSSGLFSTPDHFLDFTANLGTVQASDAWAGQHIGIGLIVTGGDGIGYWDLDNVRLTAVPEPQLVAMLALGGGMLAFRRRVKL